MSSWIDITHYRLFPQPAKAELARRCDRNGLACARVAALTRRTLFNLELAKARKADLFAFLSGLDNAGTNRFDGLSGGAGVHPGGGRDVIDQFGGLQLDRP